MVSIQDVADRAGVSVATVSRALRGLPNVATATRRRIEDAARELDYVANPNASRLGGLGGRGSTGTIGVVLPSLGTWYGAQMMAAIHSVAATAGLELLATVIDDVATRDQFVRDLPFRKRVDGLVIVDIPLTEAHYERLLTGGVPIVTTGARVVNVASVGIDDRGAARELTRLLVDLGHADVGIIEGSMHDAFDFEAPNARRDGIVDALRDAGLALRHDCRATGDWRAASGAAAALELVESCAPTAIFCFSDEMAVGAIGALRGRGIAVPDDISVVGFDGHDLAEHIGLTTVVQPVEAIGVQVTERLLQSRDDRDRPITHEILPTKLVVRSTTGVRRGSRATATV